MNIRTVTVFLDVTCPLDRSAIRRAGDVAQAVRASLSGAGYTVQTVRLATQPLSDILPAKRLQEAPQWAAELEAEVVASHIDFVAAGPVQLKDPAEYVDAVYDILQHSQKVFASVQIATAEKGMRLERLKQMGELISRVARIAADGFGNLRLSAVANVRAWSPFFPGAYHGGAELRVAVGTESADLAVAAFAKARSLEQARANLVQAIEIQAKRIEGAAKEALATAKATFQGIDFSLAPFPAEVRSIGAALEKLGIEFVGSAGTLAAASLLTDALDRAKFTRTGLCGLMLPVLEDAVLAQRAAEGHLGVSELLMYSAVCGTGLDTIPLPGDVSVAALAAVLADVAALALRLDKQLTARLMPVPGKKAGDQTGFDFEFFANTTVLGLAGSGLSGLWNTTGLLDLKARYPNQSD